MGRLFAAHCRKFRLLQGHVTSVSRAFHAIAGSASLQLLPLLLLMLLACLRFAILLAARAVTWRSCRTIGGRMQTTCFLVVYGRRNYVGRAIAERIATLSQH